MRGTSIMRDKLEDIAVVICAIPLVLGMCALYWLCRLCGIDLNDDF